MSAARNRRLGCDEVADLGAEFSLGLLDGAERAAVVAHLEGCRSCRSQVALLAEAGEQMLLVAPSAEPSAGFEQRVLDRLGPRTVRPRSRRPRPRWFVPVLAVAATALVALGASALVLRASDGDTEPEVALQHPEPEVHTATLLSAHNGRDVGGVVVVDSDPRVVEVDMAEWMERVAEWDDPPPGPWKLAVERADGAQEEHILALTDDPRPRIALIAGGAAVTKVSIQDGTGHVWCSALL